MKELPYKNKINPRTKALIVILCLFLIGIIIGLIISNIGIIFLKETADKQGIEITDTIERRIANSYSWLITITCIDAALLIGLLWIYFDTYRKTKSSFMIGLNFFIIIFLIKSILSVVYLNSFFNESIVLLPNAIKTIGTSGIGPLGFFINIFEIIAISILLYISME